MDEQKNRKAQLSSKKLKGPGALAMDDGRKWGGGMACSGRQKECSIVPKDVSFFFVTACYAVLKTFFFLIAFRFHSWYNGWQTLALSS